MRVDVHESAALRPVDESSELGIATTIAAEHPDAAVRPRSDDNVVILCRNRLDFHTIGTQYGEQHFRRMNPVPEQTWLCRLKTMARNNPPQ